MTLTAFALNCTLKPSSAGPSSTDRLLRELLAELAKLGVESDEPLRVADLDIAPGVTSDEGDGDAWPDVRRRILAADIFVLGTPIWLGHPCSNAQKVLERLDAFLGEVDDDGRMISFDRVALVAVVGNEDGAHLVGSQLFQGLNDVGFTIPAGGMTYWVGEAMHSVDYQDLPAGSDRTREATATAARTAAHLAALLDEHPYPAAPSA
ncbi:MAG: NAD(P)H-dependent oxidoreductase [Acidimicrobiales bacterium]